MNLKQKTLPIGVFDSGVGGISVLAEIIGNLPSEDFIYLADSANAPYGTKGCECVRGLSVNAARTMMSTGIKALVVACNTATSVAIQHIRNEFDIPIIGMEPALKPAVEAGKSGDIVVMATPLTLKEEKFNRLFEKYNTEATITPLPCPGLVEMIESGAESEEIRKYLLKLYKDIELSKVSSIVLGCTHYCLIKREIRDFFGGKALIVDGNAGTARHLKKILEENKLLKDETITSGVLDRELKVDFLTTGNTSLVIPLCQRFLQKSLNENTAG